MQNYDCDQAQWVSSDQFRENLNTGNKIAPEYEQSETPELPALAVKVYWTDKSLVSVKIDLFSKVWAVNIFIAQM